MTQEINVIPSIYLNNSHILYTKLVPTPSSPRGNEQYLQISKDKEPHLIVTTSLMGKIYRGVIIDDIFWFLVEDLIELTTSSASKLALIEKLLNNIPNQYKGFVCAVDSIGTREFVLMVSTQGLKDKLFS